MIRENRGHCGRKLQGLTRSKTKERSGEQELYTTSCRLPQVAEANIPPPMDAAGEPSLLQSMCGTTVAQTGLLIDLFPMPRERNRVIP
jgi:hypothetical protein